VTVETQGLDGPLDIHARESRFCITGPCGSIELLCNGVTQPRALALICHPHPLHGGSVDNKVVFTLARACRDSGVVAVRFNFRGVGASGGAHDEGVGELNDARFVLHWLRQECFRQQQIGLPVILAGFSFGAAIAAQLSQTEKIAALILAAPPVPRYSLDKMVDVAMPVLLLQGDADEVISSAAVFAWFQQLHAPQKQLQRWQQVGHFFHGVLPELKQTAEIFMSEKISADSAAYSALSLGLP
jgi:alpha/beta superfamily hydrolase